ncbi:hypothetical protein [Candidatus Parabeggiatoa sp. HSG14]|uniref:hypothetical protein n=1 Tax=Candidatus Parabeggiatoa sp. HSG14 TaxID=3055593 RepID=UPI0025A70995|nr:hypothetical protein [Thiotrichales bacterium HSG14]
MVVFAEIGDLDITRRFMKKSKQVLLVCPKGYIQENTLLYALNLCQRMGATLDIFLSNPKNQGIAAQQYFDVLVHYVKKQPTITCTVMSGGDNLDITNQWPITDCPLTIVEI